MLSNVLGITSETTSRPNAQIPVLEECQSSHLAQDACFLAWREHSAALPGSCSAGAKLVACLVPPPGTCKAHWHGLHLGKTVLFALTGCRYSNILLDTFAW